MLFHAAYNARRSLRFRVTRLGAKPSLPFANLINSGLCWQFVAIIRGSESKLQLAGFAQPEG